MSLIIIAIVEKESIKFCKDLERFSNVEILNRIKILVYDPKKRQMKEFYQMNSFSKLFICVMMIRMDEWIGFCVITALSYWNNWKNIYIMDFFVFHKYPYLTLTVHTHTHAHNTKKNLRTTWSESDKYLFGRKKMM